MGNMKVATRGRGGAADCGIWCVLSLVIPPCLLRGCAVCQRGSGGFARPLLMRCCGALFCKEHIGDVRFSLPPTSPVLRPRSLFSRFTFLQQRTSALPVPAPCPTHSRPAGTRTRCLPQPPPTCLHVPSASADALPAPGLNSRRERTRQLFLLALHSRRVGCGEEVLVASRCSQPLPSGQLESARYTSPQPAIAYV